jgi:hypothetical protein
VDCVATLTVYTYFAQSFVSGTFITAFVLVLVGLMDQTPDFAIRLRNCWPLLMPGAGSIGAAIGWEKMSGTGWRRLT